MRIEVGERYQLALRILEIHQRELAKNSGYTEGYVGMLLNGRRPISSQTRERLAEGLRRSLIEGGMPERAMSDER